MHELNFRNRHHLICDELWDLYREPSEHANVRPDLVLKTFTQRRMVRELIYLWAKKLGQEKVLILEAHANAEHGEWIFEDNKSIYSMQKWIDFMDGSFAAIMLMACNPSNTAVTSKSSILIHLFEARSLPIALNPGSMRLFIPGFGYVDRDYKKLRRIINKLK